MSARREKLLGLGEDEVFVCSTGVIGQRLPVDKVLQGIREIIPAKLAKENGSEAAYAIMTTDTVRKECAYELQLSTGTREDRRDGQGLWHDPPPIWRRCSST